MESIGGNMIKRVEDLNYLGRYIKLTDRNVNIRIVKVWTALNNMQSIWKSKLREGPKRTFSEQQLNPYLFMDPFHGL